MIKDQLREDMKAAMKAGDAVRRSTISLLLAAIKNRELEKRTKLSKAGGDAAGLEAASELTDQEVLDAISSEVKKRKESITTYEQAGRAELAASEQAELDILMTYLPAQMSDNELRTAVKEAVAHVKPADMKDMGKVLGYLMPQVKGKADGQKVSMFVKEEIEKLAHA